MKLYADLPGRRANQIAGDLLLVAFLVGCCWLGMRVNDLVDNLAAPAYRTESAASDLAGNLRGAGEKVADIPFVPDQVATPFDSGASAADKIAASGRSTAETTERLASWLGWTVGLLPALLALALVVPRRLRWVRTATAGQRFVDSGDDLDLFALRALAHQPLHVLARISPDPAGAWRRGDPEVLTRLATLEMRDSGLRPARPPLPSTT